MNHHRERSDDKRFDASLHRDWDLIVVGGGITGAGILREAAKRGLRVLLLEQNDFGAGASSRSSKLVHGGLRYLEHGRFRLTWDAVRERDELLRLGGGLILRQPFLYPTYRGRKPGRLSVATGLAIYDLIAGQKSRRHLDAATLQLYAPHLRSERLSGGYQFTDAQTDDARLVLRVIAEGCAAGGEALNYTPVEEFLRDADGTVRGVELRARDGSLHALAARVVVNATGAWGDTMRARLGMAPRLRPLRGSHFLLPAWRLPVAQAISFPHPADGRPVYAYPWEGVTLFGTTDVDHADDLDAEPRIGAAESAYLLEALRHQFPRLDLGYADVLSTYAGVRPVIASGKQDPSAERREHDVWIEDGLLTVCGGKLTTYRRIALQALRRLRKRFPAVRLGGNPGPALDPVTLPANLASGQLTPGRLERLAGRHGTRVAEFLAGASHDDLRELPATAYCRAELRWACRHEAVRHLDDLLLRRTRLGLVLPNGAAALLTEIGAIAATEMGWDAGRRDEEIRRYRDIWRRCYAPPTADERREQERRA